MTLSLAMVFFNFQGTCQKILRRQFEQGCLQPIANVIRLEFPASRKSLEESGAPVDYPWLRRMLRSDFHALTCLLKNATNLNRHGSTEERLLAQYFRWQLLSLAVRCQLKAGEEKAILRLAAVLEYFANVVGQHMNTVACGDMATAGYVTNR